MDQLDESAGAALADDERVSLAFRMPWMLKAIAGRLETKINEGFDVLPAAAQALGSGFHSLVPCSQAYKASASKRTVAHLLDSRVNLFETLHIRNNLA